MKIQPIQNCAFGKSETSNSKGKKIYRGATGLVLATGVCCLASDRLFKSPKNLKKVGKFGFWASWAGIAMIALGIGKAVYDKAMESYNED